MSVIKHFINGDNSEYSYTKDQYLDIFLNKLENTLNVEKFNSAGMGIYRRGKLLDTENHYRVNRHGYRAEEITGTEDLVFAGCSQTFGMGIPEKMIWGNQTAEELELTSTNISAPGESVYWIVQKIFAYFKEYGHPKIVCCLFPDFYRMSSPTNKNISVVNNYQDDDISVKRIQLAGRENLSQRPNFAKKPYDLQEVLPLELPMYLSHNSIVMLEEYCFSNNIKLFWGTWSNDMSALQELNKEHDVYRSIITNTDFSSIDCRSPIAQGCHSDVEEMYDYCFDMGSDEGFGMRHMGVHHHIHYSKMFTKEIMNHEKNI